MTALADFRVAQTRPGHLPRTGQSAFWSGGGLRCGPAPRTGPGRSGTMPRPCGPGRCWSWPSPPRPKYGPAGSASRRRPASAWSPSLPGIWSSLHLDTAVTLPVGVECYAAYALRAWLATGHAISDRTRRFAKRSAICSFALGMAGQVAFHLMDQDRITRAPWAITTLVSCLPVLVLGMGTALAHMLREDAAAAGHAQAGAPGPATHVPPAWSPARPIRGPARPEPAGPDRQGTPPSGPDQDAAPA